MYPYLVYQSLHDIAQRGNLDRQKQLGRSYRRGIRKGLFKVMSKMGISSISSYRGAQLFDEAADFCAAHRRELKEVEERLDAIETVKQGFGTPEEWEAFLGWFEKWFLRRVQPVEVEA